MIKFWAMLRDSYREAVDGWIMFVMMILIGVILAVILSLSASPVSPDECIPQVVAGASAGPNGARVVQSDRGKGKAQGFFFFAPVVSGVEAGPAPDGRPWEGTTTFTFSTIATVQGAAGAEVEVDDKGQPKLDKVKRESILVGDPFKEAVRYWAATPGQPKPAFSDQLAEEYVAAFVRDATKLNVTRVTKSAKPAPKPTGGWLGGLLATAPAAYEVETSGGDRVGWSHKPSFFFGLWQPDFHQPLGRLVYVVESTLLNGVGAWVILAAGVVVTAGFVPNMLRKGGIDLMISKPVSRPLILLYKYLGGLLFVFLLTAVAVGGVWVVIGLRTGVWAPGLLWCVPSITGYFAILYACSTLAGVLTRNAIVSIVVTVVFWFLVWAVGFSITTANAFDTLQKVQTAQRNQSRTAAQKDKGEAPPDEAAPPAEPEKSTALVVLEWVNRASPRMNDLDDLTTRQIAKGLLGDADRRDGKARSGLQWAEVVGVASAWLALFLGLATLRFVTRSY